MNYADYNINQSIVIDLILKWKEMTSKKFNILRFDNELTKLIDSFQRYAKSLYDNQAIESVKTMSMWNESTEVLCNAISH